MKCSYIFKKGLQKGKTCDKLNCKRHDKNKGKDKMMDILLNSCKKILLKKNFNIRVERIEKINNMEITTNQEYIKNKNFIDLFFQIPWGEYWKIKDKDDLNCKIVEFERIFENNIFGMKKIKNELINYICKIYSTSHNSKFCNILGLYGKAGLSKTQIIKIMSESLELPMYTISLGGAKNSNILLGNDFLYVESNPGKIVNSFIQTQNTTRTVFTSRGIM